MTKRVHSLLVTLDHDMREDDVNAMIHAFKQFRNVIAVHKNVADIASTMAISRAKFEIREAIMEQLLEEYPK